ncbi:NTP transferase domain-containing protein [Massilia sp. Leaf139]|uniref:nucleotidyltransferase family protein n=1 Tax=Massilia sp. Leaf139 TaxID=1736272 RepID=UPI0006FADE60|nr:nucleotidyltransferase family protein [Massilia sp. Leaf139]KQQ93580.1 molybdopterin-guanine dinucleotide biosynthesis protein MobA [Massilia sp. Leaf139]
MNAVANVAGILLAAGRGRRFDPRGTRNKLLQPLPSGELVVAASARNLFAVLPRVIAVVPPEDGGVAAALRALGCEVTLCADADSGMAASLVHAIGCSLPQAAAWLVALGDMPYVAPSTLHALLAALEEGADIAAPVFDGRRGNPVAFGLRHLPALLALEGEYGARALLKSAPVTEVAVDDPGILRDIDTPADLA